MMSVLTNPDDPDSLVVCSTAFNFLNNMHIIPIVQRLEDI